MAKAVETDANAQAVQTMLSGLPIKKKLELFERNDRLRIQFLQKQKMSHQKAREPMLDAFLASAIEGDKKSHEAVYGAWLKEKGNDLGQVPAFPDRFKREPDPDAPAPETDPEADLKEATATFKTWAKTGDLDLINVFARLGPYDFPAKALAALKKPASKAKASEEGEGGEAGGGVSEAALAELRQAYELQLAELKAKHEAEQAKQEAELEKFKRLLEENKNKRKTELQEVQELAKADFQKQTSEWQRQEVLLRREIEELKKGKQEANDKVNKVRDELLELRQLHEKAERDLKRTHHKLSEEQEHLSAEQEELSRLKARIEELEASEASLLLKAKALARFENAGAAVAIASADNLRIWEEIQSEHEVKEGLQRKFNLETIAREAYDHDEKDLQEVWTQLLAVEQGLVDRFFSLPFSELEEPTGELRDLITAFIELKDSLVAREQLAHLVNFVGNRFLTEAKQPA